MSEMDEKYIHTKIYYKGELMSAIGCIQNKKTGKIYNYDYVQRKFYPEEKTQGFNQKLGEYIELDCRKDKEL